MWFYLELGLVSHGATYLGRRKESLGSLQLRWRRISSKLKGLMFDLTQGRVGATLAKMTMFTTMGMVSILGFALADAYYVGILGKNYLASISAVS